MADSMRSSYTVVIPTWNRERTLARTIYSALSQTVPPLEVLVCDDGSHDSSEAVVREFGRPVVWCPGDRGGRPAIPRNRGIRESKGEWIAFLDSDDEWLPEKAEKQFSLMERTNCGASCTNAYRLVPDERCVSILLQSQKETLRLPDLLDDNLVVCSSVLLHRSLLEMAVGFPEDKALTALEDYALWLRIATQTPFAFVNEPLIVYLDDPLHSIRKEGVEQSAQRQTVFGNFQEWAKRYGSEDYTAELRKSEEKRKQPGPRMSLFASLRHLWRPRTL